MPREVIVHKKLNLFFLLLINKKTHFFILKKKSTFFNHFFYHFDSILQLTGETVGEVKAVADMHQRKAEMAKHSDAFIALPGKQLSMQFLC
jgi:predicted Rossmann-fold nucleotide-binding protein